MNYLDESISKNNNIIDYKRFKEMLNIINNNKTSHKIKTYQKMNSKNFKNLNNDIKADILKSININKKIFYQIIGLNKINLNIYQSSKSRKELISKNISNENLNNKEISINNNNDDIKIINYFDEKNKTETDCNVKKWFL